MLNSLSRASRLTQTLLRTSAATVAALCVVAIFTAPLVAGDNSDRITSFAGVWHAPEYKVAANTDLDVAVWGRNASKVRNVQLFLEPDGHGVLRVHNSVVDARGRVRPYSASVVEAHLKLEAPGKWDDTRIEPIVTVISAEERYLDGTGEKTVIEGLKVSINSMTNMQTINIRYDTARGTGSFGETLTRHARRGAAARSAAAIKRAASDRS
jgi:hypothetical protein